MKQPWEMTRSEIGEVMNNPYGNLPDVYLSKKQIKEREIWDNRLDKYHKRKIQEAISEGKPVPTEVLAEYSDLENWIKQSL